MSKIPLRRIKGPYDPSEPIRTHFPNPTMAKQSFQAECDINTIMKKYEATGLVTHTQTIQGSYGDYTHADDYHSSLNRVMAADAAFMALPSKIRLRFNNDAGDFLEFIEDPNNREEAESLGLISPSKPERSDIEAKPKSPAEPTGDSSKKTSAKADPKTATESG